ncbi:MAG TPA: circularly permuted type 2 ATP-grasp protein [Geminicoccaceae bacterium]|nr:circularly permuted type 2 ATP-grasp protein [Geminicoccaceae bacterium]
MQVQVQGAAAARAGGLAGYDPGRYFCEFEHCVRHSVSGRLIRARLDALGLDELAHRARAAEAELYNQGITFTIYSDGGAIDRILPFDVIPRVITAWDWGVIEAGVRQRVRALNLFLADVYGAGKVLKDGVVPAELVLGNPNYRPEMRGLELPHGTYIHVNGTDLVRGGDGTFRVLEDNGRSPSGVSYVVENRHLMLRAFSDLMKDLPVRPVSDYGRQLHEKLSEAAPVGVGDPQVVLLSPGVFNSAYFEHVFLAREMGVPLVEGRDLVVEDDRVHMRTVAGPVRVDVIYRRINDDFLDPEVFNPASMLGMPGLMRAYRKGTVALANAIGTGVADDKAVYAYVPRLIHYYLAEEPILDNVETRICREPDALAYTLDRLAELVVKPVGESGGYGITIGPRATRAEIALARERLLADPANYISQPVIDLSVSPTLVDGAAVEPRHVDLRPFAVTGRTTWVLPGGLSRVALKRGSLVVNSSQGGGSKDTWVLRERAA